MFGLWAWPLLFKFIWVDLDIVSLKHFSNVLWRPCTVATARCGPLSFVAFLFLINDLALN